jgi:DNA polymerase-1
MLKKLINTYNPDWLAVVFDSKEPTFRHDLFPDYKINRIQMPDDLATQIPPLFEIIENLGFSLVRKPGLEADDIIGGLAAKASRDNIFTIISTGDKDLAQLVNDDVVLINTMNDTLLDRDGVFNKFAVPPELIIDYLILTGDKVDNIPGVTGVGPKTAIKLLSQYKNLAGIIENVDQITGKVGDNIRATIEHFPLYRQLVTIDPDTKVDAKIKDFVIKQKNTDQLRTLFTNLEMNSWLKDLNKLDITKDSYKQQPDAKLQQPTTPINWQQQIKLASQFAIYVKPDLSGIYLATETDNIYLDQTEIHKNLTVINQYLKDKNKQKVTYDLKSLLKICDQHKINIKPPFIDVTLESYVINSLIKNNLPIDTIDAGQILQLHNNLWPQITAEPTLQSVLEDIEMPLLLVLHKMEQIGVLIDPNKLQQQGKSIAKQLDKLEQEIYLLADEEFNVNSPKQLQEIFYDKLELPILQKTPKGQPSTAEPVLQELSLEFELPKLILEYRSLNKLQTTYIDKLPNSINPATGRVHTSYHQTVTATGRLSSSDPNLQNIPIRTAEGREIRKAFIARKHYKILSADYSQIELRILAHLSEDPNLIKAFSQDLDIHAITASEVFGVKIDEVTAELRRQAKAINFGLIYGMSEFGLAKQLKISRIEADNYIQSYFTKFPKVLEFMEATKQFAANNGFVETMFGRRLYLPEINSKNGMRRKAAQRAAINAPMQGAQADLIKIAMVNIDKWLTKQATDIFMLMQVHDELIFEVPENKLDLASKKIQQLMADVADLRVNLKVDVGVGDNWGDIK